MLHVFQCKTHFWKYLVNSFLVNLKKQASPSKDERLSTEPNRRSKSVSCRMGAATLPFSQAAYKSILPLRGVLLPFERKLSRALRKCLSWNYATQAAVTGPHQVNRDASPKRKWGGAWNKGGTHLEGKRQDKQPLERWKELTIFAIIK